MERLKAMKECISSAIQGQMSNLSQVDTHELGEAVDILKDLEESMYYCSIVKAMEKAEKEEEMMASLMKKEGREDEYHRNRMFYPMYPNYPNYPPIINYYSERLPNPYYHDERMERDMDRYKGRMYYSGGGSNGGSGMSNGNSGMSNGNSGGSNGSRGYQEYELPLDMMNMRDSREGRAPQSRRMYMESKEMHKDQAHKMKDLEKYMQDLGQDIVEMIQDATPEEKKTLERKISALAGKVAQLNA